jgi:mannose-1-phosphate guanylyltransferase
VPIRSFILLAGAGTKSLSSRLGRSVLDLPITADVRLLDVWQGRIQHFLAQAGAGPDDVEGCRLVVSLGESDVLPAPGSGEGLPPVRIAKDASDLRGTAGALRDLCVALSDSDQVVVGVASQCPDEGDLGRLVEEADPSAGVTLTADPDGAPSGLMVLRRAALESIPAIGFIDLKEQALPKIAKTHGVAVRGCVGVSPPLRDLATYLQALRSWHRSGSLRGLDASDPFGERWAPAFSVVEPGAQVAANARLHDSVVLSGAVVESGCEIVRSVVGPGAVVRKRTRVVSQLVVAGGRGDER